MVDVAVDVSGRIGGLKAEEDVALVTVEALEGVRVGLRLTGDDHDTTGPATTGSVTTSLESDAKTIAPGVFFDR